MVNTASYSAFVFYVSMSEIILVWQLSDCGFLSLGGIDKIRNHLVTNPIYRDFPFELSINNRFFGGRSIRISSLSEFIVVHYRQINRYI